LPPTVFSSLQVELEKSDRTEQAARAQALARQHAEVARLETRVDTLYEDRLDGRIDAAMYDKKAGDLREQREQLRHKIRTMQETALPSVSAAIDLMKLTSRAAELFLGQEAEEQRRLLHLVLKQASWKEGELRMSLRESFEEFRLSNSGTDRDQSEFGVRTPNFDNWRRERDSNPR
jgi:site-specific DNA recombinase